MLIRSVLDCRPDQPKYMCCTLLLVASWLRHVAGTAKLEIIVLGHPPAALTGFFDNVGVQWQITDADPALDFFGTGNTLLGAQQHGTDDRILLVDNDVYFRADIRELSDIPDTRMAGARAGNVRVRPEQWAEIGKALGLAPLNQPWTIIRSQVAALKDPDAPLQQDPLTYVNGGVLLLPKGDTFVQTWRAHIIRIADHFRDHPLKSAAVVASNMAGLATAIGDHGDFEWLSDGMNYRHRMLLLNELPLEQIKMLHMTGHPKTQETLPVQGYVSAHVAQYWNSRVLMDLRSLEAAHGARAYATAMANVQAVMQEMQSTIGEYNLDQVMQGALSERSVTP